MIDTHCHLLYGIDDGPATPSEAVTLAGQLASAGVETVVCTPHYSRRYPTDVALAEARLDELREHLGASGLRVSLSLAAEVSSAFAVSEPLDALAARVIGGRYLLVELEPTTSSAVLQTVIERLEPARLRPIFAHPERCDSVREQPRLLSEARDAGALAQVVASSLVGRWGEAVGAGGWRLLDGGLVDLLASDSHRPARGPETTLQRAAQAVAERYGADVLAELTELAPARVLDGAGGAA